MTCLGDALSFLLEQLKRNLKLTCSKFSKRILNCLERCTGKHKALDQMTQLVTGNYFSFAALGKFTCTNTNIEKFLWLTSRTERFFFSVWSPRWKVGYVSHHK